MSKFKEGSKVILKRNSRYHSEFFTGRVYVLKQSEVYPDLLTITHKNGFVGHNKPRFYEDEFDLVYHQALKEDIENLLKD